MKSATVDAYIEAAPIAARPTLNHLREVIRGAIPEAEEVISYGIPTYKFHGMVISFAAFKNHCSLFPGHTVADFAVELVGYKTSKGTIQFPHAEPPPDELIVRIAQHRARENSANLVS